MPFDITFTAVPTSGTIDELITDCGFFWREFPQTLGIDAVLTTPTAATGSVLTQTINGPVDTTYNYVEVVGFGMADGI